jgi:hypothetical protein
MGLTKHLARSRCLVADDLLFAAIVIICKHCLTYDANLSALTGRRVSVRRIHASRRGSRELNRAGAAGCGTYLGSGLISLSSGQGCPAEGPQILCRHREKSFARVSRQCAQEVV